MQIKEIFKKEMFVDAVMTECTMELVHIAGNGKEGEMGDSKSWPRRSFREREGLTRGNANRLCP